VTRGLVFSASGPSISTVIDLDLDLDSDSDHDK
jgi:hypothetical protein